MGELRMPSLGADMEAGTVVEWKVAPGDQVHRGDIVLVIESEKSTMEVEVFEDGVVDELIAEPGDEVPVGGVLATIRAETPSAPAATRTAPAPAWPLSSESHAVHSPVLRHLAQRLDVDVATIHGTGLAGAITRADIERAAERRMPVATPRPTTVAPMPRSPSPDRLRATPYARRLAHQRGIDLRSLASTGAALFGRDIPEAPTSDVAISRQAAVAALMARSKREIPHFYVQHTIDLREAIQWLTTTNEQRPVQDRLLPAALFLHATAKACMQHPTVNGHWRNGGFIPAAQVQLGVAVHLRDGGLIAPSIAGADELSIDGTMRALRDLVGRTRRGVLRASDAIEPSITVTNVGDQGVEQIYGVIYPPQVAIVGFGAVVERPWAVDGEISVHPVVHVTVSADHRAVNGHAAARFLRTIDDLLQRPDLLAHDHDDGLEARRGGRGPSALLPVVRSRDDQLDEHESPVPEEVEP